MSQIVNIPLTKTDDPNYRYRMPRMHLITVSHRKGTKTQIRNLADVAKALQVDQKAVIKYLSVELGTQSDGDTMLKGKFQLDLLETHLNEFIMKYVCCTKCTYPELQHYYRNKKELVGVCSSCGTVKKQDCAHAAGKQLLLVAKTAGNKEPIQPDGPVVKPTKTTRMQLTDPRMAQECELLSQFISDLEADMSASSSSALQSILRQLHQIQFKLGVTREYKFYMALCAIFGGEENQRDLLMKWDDYEPIFTQLIAQDDSGKGNLHFFQALCIFFVKVRPQSQKNVVNLLQKFWENETIENFEGFMNDWYANNLRLDSESKLYDQDAENTMRQVLVPPFMEWLNSEEDDEEETKEPLQISIVDNSEINEQQLQQEQKQRELIEIALQRQKEMLENARIALTMEKKLKPPQDCFEVENDFNIDDI